MQAVLRKESSTSSSSSFIGLRFCGGLIRESLARVRWAVGEVYRILLAEMSKRRGEEAISTFSHLAVSSRRSALSGRLVLGSSTRSPTVRKYGYYRYNRNQSQLRLTVGVNSIRINNSTTRKSLSLLGNSYINYWAAFSSPSDLALETNNSSDLISVNPDQTRPPLQGAESLFSNKC